MVTQEYLRAAVDPAFEVVGRELAPWPAPHPDRPPLEIEYSRLTDAAKWRIVGARAEAWIIALVDAGLATVERTTEVGWKVPPATVISRTDRVVPRAAGAKPMVVARSQLGEVPDAGVTLGVGDPALCVAWFPQCGCNARDGGFREVLEDLDSYVLGVVSGAFRHLTSGPGEMP